MAKIYGTPIMAGGAGGANKDLPPLLDNFKAFKGGGTSENPHITIQAGKMATSRANELAGAVWVYGDHIPKNVNDGTKIQLTREEIIRPDTDPYITLADIPVSDAETETIVNLKESDGKLHPYLYLSNNYESSGSGLFLRKQSLNEMAYKSSAGDIKYEDSGVDVWCETEFRSKLDGHLASQIVAVNIPSYKSSLTRSIFLLSTSELGLGFESDSGKEGEVIPYFNSAQRRICNNDLIVPAKYATRTPYNDVATLYYWYVDTSGAKQNARFDATSYMRPAFCLPLVFKLKATKNEDGSYDMYDETSAASTLSTSETAESNYVTCTIQWDSTKNFFARQFTYNSKKQYQTMLEGAIATITLVGAPEPVSELAETHSGSSITLTWKNPTSDELYDHTVVVYKTDDFPTSIDDGTQGYSGTDETATLSDLELGTTYYIAVFTVSYIGVYGQPETIQVEIPAGQLLSSLASGTKVKLGKWKNTDLQWKVARDTSDQSIRLVLEPTSVSLLGNMQYDAKEPNNSDSNRKSYGNNRYIYSNIHQWLNATKASGWYTAQHSADAAPAYSSSPGFLSGWSENHINALDNATLTTSRSSVDGGGTETFVARVALISTTELGLQNSTGGGRLDIFNSDGDRAIGSVYWTRTPYPLNSDFEYLVAGTGGLGGNSAYNAFGVRPLCTPASTALVSLEMDDDNCYVVQ